MARSTFVYVTFIRTTPQRLWAARTTPEFTKQYWFGMSQQTDWKAGAVKLTITHVMGRAASKFIDAVSGGWPRILSNLKSLLETEELPLKAETAAG